MMWYRIKSFFKFYWQAGTKYNVQSPFLHDFVTNVLDTDKQYYAFSKIEKVRHQLLSDHSVIIIEDHGAGSQQNGNNRRRRIAAIASTSVSDSGKCRLLFQICNYYHSNNIIELGTSLGISSAYLAAADGRSKVVTMEGAQNIAEKAAEVHRLLGYENIEIKVGPFDQNLDEVLSEMGQVDFVFLDGNHNKAATLRYFDKILPFCNDHTIIVLDDIYWSEGMTAAWKEIEKHVAVTLSIDLFDIGIVFLSKNLSKQQVSYIPYKYKPWRIGLFG